MSASPREHAFVAARREKLLDARERSLTFEQIVAAGLPDPVSGRTPDEHFASYHGSVAAAVQDAKRALMDRARQGKVLGDYLIAEELGRLQALERRAHTVLLQASQSRDHLNTLRAIEQLRKLSERRAALLGLDQVSAQAASDSGGRGDSVLDEVGRKRARRRAAVARAAG